MKNKWRKWLIGAAAMLGISFLFQQVKTSDAFQKASDAAANDSSAQTASPDRQTASGSLDSGDWRRGGYDSGSYDNGSTYNQRRYGDPSMSYPGTQERQSGNVRVQTRTGRS